MPRKPLKMLKRKPKFEQWELDFMRSGPPDWEIAKKSAHRWDYLDGREIWESMKQEPGINLNDYPWALKAFEGRSNSGGDNNNGKN